MPPHPRASHCKRALHGKEVAPTTDKPSLLVEVKYSLSSCRSSHQSAYLSSSRWLTSSDIFICCKDQAENWTLSPKGCGKIQSLEVTGKPQGVDTRTLPEFGDSGPTATMSRCQSPAPIHRKHWWLQLGPGLGRWGTAGGASWGAASGPRRCQRSWEDGKGFRWRAGARGSGKEAPGCLFLFSAIQPTKAAKSTEVKPGGIGCETEQLGGVNSDVQGWKPTGAGPWP